MLHKKKIYNLIESFYLKAERELNNGNIKSICKILYEEMPVELYDISIYLSTDRNYDKLPESTKQLINLIRKITNEIEC